MGIAVRNLSKRFGNFTAIDGVSFEVPSGQLVALLGPSGSGKSTILRIIAGLEPADSGEVELTGEDATHLPVQLRGVGFVFQHYALFRHMTVRQNVAFGLEVQRPRPPKQEIKARVDELLELIQESYGYADRFPTQLSGGQSSEWPWPGRARADPKVLLLDEPFGALDSKVRTTSCALWLRRLHDEVHVTSLFVTHDQQEAFEGLGPGRRVVQGRRSEQMGPPQELYEKPASPFVTEFLGSVNVLRISETVLGMDHWGDGVPFPASISNGEPRASVGLCAFRMTSRSPASATDAPPGPPGSAASLRWGASFALTSCSSTARICTSSSPASAHSSSPLATARISSSHPEILRSSARPRRSSTTT